MTVKAKKVLSVLSGIVIALFLILAVACLFVSISYKIQGEDGELFGRQFRIVTSGSMEPEIATGAIVCIDTAPDMEDGEARQNFMDSLEVGNVITFYDWYYIPGKNEDKDEDNEGVVVTHRIVEIQEGESGRTFVCHGDAADEGEVQHVDEDNVIGIVEWDNLALGKVVQFFRTNVGIVVCLILPAALILLYEVIHISRILSERKREKREEEAAAREEEIERLRRELDEIKKSGGRGE